MKQIIISAGILIALASCGNHADSNSSSTKDSSKSEITQPAGVDSARSSNDTTSAANTIPNTNSNGTSNAATPNTGASNDTGGKGKRMPHK